MARFNLEIDYSLRHQLPGFLSESYTGEGARYTGDVGIPDIAVTTMPRITCSASLYSLGVAYMNKGDHDQALKAYERALSCDPKYAMVLSNLGTVYVSSAARDKDKAALMKGMDYFKRAIDSDPNYASAYNGLGAAYRLAGDIDAAIFCWAKAVGLQPNHRFALYNLGLAYLDKGDKAKALAYLTRYKDRYYKVLSAGDKASLDADLEKCR